MKSPLEYLISRYPDKKTSLADIIPWSSPVPSFGNYSTSTVATLGLNPSNREFVDVNGKELDGQLRRFHTLNSLGLRSWKRSKKTHHSMITNRCNLYFQNNPYDLWFKKLDYLFSASGYSYYGKDAKLCHLDLVPFATSSKWTDLSSSQKAHLLDISADALALIIKKSPIKAIVLNGRTVIDRLSELSDMQYELTTVKSWALPRKDGLNVAGYACKGVVTKIGNVRLSKPVKILGYNHNIQSSFGVTKQVQDKIKFWIAANLRR